MLDSTEVGWFVTPPETAEQREKSRVKLADGQGKYLGDKGIGRGWCRPGEKGHKGAQGPSERHGTVTRLRPR